MSMPAKSNRAFLWVTAILVILLAFIHRNRLFSIAPLISGDWPYFFADQLKDWFPLHPLWITYDGLGRSISQGNFIFLLSFYSLLAKIGLHFEVISRLLFFLPVIVLAPYGAFLAVKQLTKNNLGAILGACVYSLNTYFLVIQGGHMHLCMVYALAPFAYYFAARDAPRSYFWLFTLLAVMSLYDVRMTLIVGLFAGLIAIWHRVKSRADFFRFLRAMALGGIALALISSFWLLPTLATKSGPFTRDVFSLEALNWVSQSDSFTLHHPFWSPAGVTDFVFQPAPFYMYLLPLMAFLPFVFKKVRFRRELLFYGCIGLLSMIFLIQENSLFGPAYKVIYENIPIMSMFRESSKVFFITVFCYSVLIGLLVTELQQSYRRWVPWASAAVLVGLILPATPYVVGLYAKAFKQEAIPKDILAINSLIAKDPDFHRNLWVSRTPKFAHISREHPSVDALDLGQTFWARYADAFDNLSYLKEPNTPALLNFAGIRYITVPEDKPDSAYRHYEDKPASEYEAMVGRLPLTKIGTYGKNTVWENNGGKPYTYFATDVWQAESIRTFSGIDPSLTTAYIFKDQNKKLPAKQQIPDIANNQEHSLYQPAHLTIDAQAYGTTFKTPSDAPYDLYRPDKTAKGRAFTVEKNIDPGQTVSTPLDRPVDNAYSNGSFELDRPVRVSDCNNFDNTSNEVNGIGGKLVGDAPDGDKALRVTASAHIACFSQKILRFNKNAHYFIGIDYKYISGAAPQIALYPYATEPTNRRVTLDTSKPGEWKRYQTILSPNNFSDEMYLIVYVPTNPEQKSELIVDNIRIYALPGEPEAYLRTQRPATSPTSLATVERSSHRHKLLAKGLKEPRLLVFSEAFNPNWELRIAKHGTKDTAAVAIAPDNHLIANGFANGWWLDPAQLPEHVRSDDGAYDIILTYAPAPWLGTGLAIAGITVLVSGLYLVYSIRRIKPKQEGYWRWQ